MNEPGGFITDHGTQGAIPRVVDSALCATCDAHPARFGGIRCQACLDAEWARLAAQDPDWYALHRVYHRQGEAER